MLSEEINSVDIRRLVTMFIFQVRKRKCTLILGELNALRHTFPVSKLDSNIRSIEFQLILHSSQIQNVLKPQNLFMTHVLVKRLTPEPTGSGI